MYRSLREYDYFPTRVVPSEILSGLKYKYVRVYYLYGVLLLFLLAKECLELFESLTSWI